MKTLILGLLLISSTAFARGVPLPTCKTQGTEQLIEYQTPVHFYMDFCQNDKGIESMPECKAYFHNSDPQLLQQELEQFLEKRAAKVCGK